MIDQQTGEIINDNSPIIAELKVELKRVGETLSGERVKQWCEKAGYLGIFYLDREGLLGLLTAVKKIPTPQPTQK